MANEDILREYLIKLGFKIDDGQQRKFRDQVSRLDKELMSLGETAVAAGAAIEFAVERTAKQLEDLYFASIRSQATAKNLATIGYAASQIGVGSEEAKAQVEDLARSLRQSPGTESLINSLGVQTRDANGHLRDMTAIYHDLAGQLNHLPVYVQAQFAAQLGLSADALYLYQRQMQGADAATADYAQRLKDAGVDVDGLAKDSHTFMTELRKMESEFGIVAMQIENTFLPWVNATVKAIETFAEVVAKADVATDGWSTRIGTLMATLAAASGIKAAISRVFGGAAAAAGGAAAGSGAGVAIPGAVLAVTGAVAVGSAMAQWSSAQRIAAGDRPESYDLEGNPIWNHAMADYQKAMDFFISRGWSKAQAAGIVANLMAESGLNANRSGDGGRAYGIAQWHPDRQAAFARWSGHDIKGSTLDEQLGFVDYELRGGSEQAAGRALAGATTAAAAGTIVSNQYERPADAGAAALRGQAAADIFGGYQVGGGSAGGAVTINQTNNNTVTGVSDPNEAASAIDDAHERNNGDLVRNMTTIHQ